MIFPAQRPRGLRRRRRGFGAARRPVPQLMQRRSGGAPARLPSAHRRAIDGCQAAGRAEPSRAVHGPRRAEIGLLRIRVHCEIKSAVLVVHVYVALGGVPGGFTMGVQATNAGTGRLSRC